MFYKEDYYEKYEDRAHLKRRLLELDKVVPNIQKITGIYGKEYTISDEPNILISEFSKAEQNAIFEMFVISELMTDTYFHPEDFKQLKQTKHLQVVK